MRIPILATAAAISAAIFATAVQAQEKASDEARAAFQEGVQRYEAGRVEAALDAFRTAYKLNPSWKIRFNIGQCEAALKRYGLAVEAFEAYLAEGGDEIDTDRRDQVLAELDKLRKMTGSVMVEGPAGMTIIVDGIERGTTPLSGRLRLVAGVDHQVVGKEGDTVVSRRTVRVGGGESLTVNIGEEEGPAEAGGGKEPVPAGGTGQMPSIEPEKERGLPVLFWVGAGLTVATLGTGIGFGAASSSRYDDFDSANKKVAAGTLPPDDPDRLDARNDVKTYDRVANAMFITSGVLAAATAAVLIVHFTGDEEPESGEAEVSIAPGGVAVSF